MDNTIVKPYFHSLIPCKHSFEKRTSDKFIRTFLKKLHPSVFGYNTLDHTYWAKFVLDNVFAYITINLETVYENTYFCMYIENVSSNNFHKIKQMITEALFALEQNSINLVKV